MLQLGFTPSEALCAATRLGGEIMGLGHENARPSYVRTSPKFEAPLGSRYEWLNKSLFIGTLNPMPPPENVVIIRVFRVT